MRNWKRTAMIALLVIANLAVIAVLFHRVYVLRYGGPSVAQTRSMTHPARPHWVPDASSKTHPVGRWQTFTYEVYSPEHWRTPEFEVKKPANTWRIVVVGECVAFGQGVADGETYAARLQERLDAAGGEVRYEVINASGGAPSPRQVLALLKGPVPDLSPDLVLFAPGASTVLEHEHLYEPTLLWLPQARYGQLMADYDALLREAGQISRDKGFKLAFITPTMTTFFLPDGIYWLDRMVAVAAELHIPCFNATALLGGLEKREGVSLEAEEGRQRLVRHRDGVREVLLDVAWTPPAAGPYVSREIYAYFDAHPDFNLTWFIDENHPNARGHEVLAEALHDFLRKESLLRR
jgi:hypothetical protein